jgi:hypothetical protein
MTAVEISVIDAEDAVGAVVLLHYITAVVTADVPRGGSTDPGFLGVATTSARGLDRLQKVAGGVA